MQKITKKEHARRMEFALQEAARVWGHKKAKKITMIPNLTEAFAETLVKHMYEVHLGCATTRELLAEISARIELSDMTLDYKTLQGDV